MDYLVGTDGNDERYGMESDDQLDGSWSDDVYIVGSPADAQPAELARFLQVPLKSP
ncbi:hypothetical protein [Pseudomonas fitomaticsae]|uniref:Uncharacterized protein n=1 Tax=Pseudomonas fitomaticsae TaxID=2837969 RepID=A0ABY3Q6Z3_9PSED|nr:hypothetical protein [Pseudomonas fitomaticsae]UFQ01794.1 hypothetical protein KJY40_08900 [Pseudomonas fitomaticsae]